jgi:hypothetical protein
MTDENAEDDMSDASTAVASSDVLAVVERTLSIGTEVNTYVDVTIELRDRPASGEWPTRRSGAPSDISVQLTSRDQAVGA